MQAPIKPLNTGAAASGKLNRKQASDALGASVRTLRRHHGVDLHPSIDEEGRYWYDAAEIARLRETREKTGGDAATVPPNEGQVAARVFAQFRAGKMPTQVVEQLELTPGVVMALHQQWLDLGQGFRVVGADLAKLEKLLGRAVRSPAALNACVEFLMRRYAKLAAFRYDCAHCNDEVVADPHREWRWLVKAGCLDAWGHAECMEAARQR